VSLKSKNTLSVLAGLMLVASLAYAPAAFAEGLEIEADAVEGATTIHIHGTTDSTQAPVIIKVLAPNGNLVSIDQINVGEDGSFDSEIGTGGPLWKQDGVYTIEAQQGSSALYGSSVEVEIADGAVVPEFGTIASLVLVVAITSIVILSAKGRLSFTPRI
jgi:predicted secreted protein with PEFG-CTERM motif